MKKEKSLTIVIKLGTSSIVDERTHEPLLSVLSGLVETSVKLQHEGHKVVIVSSGAIGVGLRRMDLDKRPKHLPKVQALAAIGQCRLMSLWDQLFAHMRQPVAQILLTRNDIADRTQYLNARNTLAQLLEMGVIPIVNENDTLAVSEIKFGDNDTLSAITAGMVHADYLFLMTDVDCLYDKNPRTNPDAKPIEVVKDVSELQVDVSSRGSSLGTGGMSTKLVAARLATSAGVTTVITRSSKPGNIGLIVKHVEDEKLATVQKTTSSTVFNSMTSSGTLQTTVEPRLANGTDASALANNDTANTDLPTVAIGSTTPKPTEVSTTAENIARSPSLSAAAAISTPSSTLAPSVAATDPVVPPPLHTRFEPDQPIRDRYFWLLHGLAPHGKIMIDEGAFKALSSKAGLLPAGVVDVEGVFAQQESVRVFVVRRIANALPEGPAYEKLEAYPSEVGRALVNYSSSEIKRIKNHKATEISDLIGYADSEYVALRENIAFFRPDRSRPVTPSLENLRFDLGSSPRSPRSPPVIPALDLEKGTTLI